MGDRLGRGGDNNSPQIFFHGWNSYVACTDENPSVGRCVSDDRLCFQRKQINGRWNVETILPKSRRFKSIFHIFDGVFCTRVEYPHLFVGVSLRRCELLRFSRQVESSGHLLYMISPTSGKSDEVPLPKVTQPRHAAHKILAVFTFV